MKKLWLAVALAVCLVLVVSFAVAGCGDKAADDALIGTWTDPSGIMEFEFESDGTMIIRAMGEEEKTTFTVNDGKLGAPNPETGEIDEITYKIDGDSLILGEGGEEGIFVRKK